MEQIDLFESGMLECPEEWRPVKGWEGWYEVSNKGRVRSLICNSSHGLCKRTIPRIKSLLINYDGYIYIRLHKNCFGKGYFVHRLVAEAFIPNPQNLPQINHKDEDKTNNCVENLEWCDGKYNVNYGTGKYRSAKNRCKMVNQFTMTGEFVKTWSSQKEAGENGFDDTLICKCCKGLLNSHKGYIWRYVE